MDRNKRRANYIGTQAGSHTMRSLGLTSGGRRKKLFSRIRGVVIPVALLVVAALVVYAALQDTGRKGIGRASRIGATLNQNVTAFGGSVIFYDGTTLHCVAASGGEDWSYRIGSNADFDTSAERIVAWSGSDLFIINQRGRLTYNSSMSDTIQFASVGDRYVAAFVGEPDNGVITVINENGNIVDSITVSNQTLLDIGFFYSATTSSQSPTELMWVLGLDSSGTVISTELQTYQPGKLSTGNSSLGEHIAYKIFDADGTLNVVDTRRISHFNYRALETASPTLIYGYRLEDVRKIGNTTYQMLLPENETAEGYRISNIRLMSSGADRMLHLPNPCMAAALGTKSVYGFSDSVVYVCRYGETEFTGYSMPITVTSVLGMLSDNRVIAASGSDIYVVELPT